MIKSELLFNAYSTLIKNNNLISMQFQEPEGIPTNGEEMDLYRPLNSIFQCSFTECDNGVYAHGVMTSFR